MEGHKTFIPAASFDWLLPLYDPMTKLLGLDKARRILLSDATLPPNSRVLEIGCGTGSFSILIKRLHPDAYVVGLDPDAKALARAQRKADQAKVQIQLDQGFSDSLPHQKETFDVVFSSMMFHHLDRDAKEKTLSEVHRVLKRGGLFAMLDLTKPESAIGSLLSRLFHSSDLLKDNSESQILRLLNDAGLRDARIVRRGKFLIGNVSHYQALNLGR